MSHSPFFSIDVLKRIIFDRYSLVCLLLLILMAMNTVHGYWEGDFWEHSAVVRELSTNPVSPKHPILLIDAPHAFYSPYALSVALAAKATSVDPVTALEVAGMINLIFLLISFRLFIGSLFKDNANMISFYAILFVLFLWPADKAWLWSGFLHINVLGKVLPYPSTFALAMTFLIFAGYIHALRAKKIGLVIAVSCLTGIVLITHPPTALFTIIGIIAISWNGRGITGRMAILYCFVVLGGAMLLAYAWPYYPFMDLIFNSSTQYHSMSKTLYSSLLARTYPLLLASPILIFRFYKNHNDIISLMFFGCMIVYLFGIATESYGMGRVISSVAIICQIGVAALAWDMELSIRKGKYWTTIPLLILIASIIALNVGSYQAFARAVNGTGKDNLVGMDIIAKHTKQYDVIITDLDGSWKIPTFGGKVVSSRHFLAWIPDRQSRRKDLIDFFNDHADSYKLRRALLKKYNVDYVLVFPRRMKEFALSSGIGKVIYSDSHIRLYDVKEMQ